MKYLKELLILAEQQKKKLAPLKVGAKTVNDVLRSKRGGSHYSPKTDFRRAKEKVNTMKTVSEAEDGGMKYYTYSLWYERKDYGNGDGGDEHDTGYTRGTSKEEVIARLKRLHSRTYNVELKEISEEAYKKAQASDD